MIDANAEVLAKRNELQKELSAAQASFTALNKKIRAIKLELEPLNRKLKTENLIVGSLWTIPHKGYYETTRREVQVLYKSATFVIFMHAGYPERMGIQEFLGKGAFKSLT